jgi:hypothetical protein
MVKRKRERGKRVVILKMAKKRKVKKEDKKI